MKVLRLLNLTIDKFLQDNAKATILSEPIIVRNGDNTQRRSQSLIELPNGKKYAINIVPVGDSKPEVKA
jgi:hypothetical protein